MTSISLLNASEDLTRALLEYRKQFKQKWKWANFSKDIAIDVENGQFIVVHNQVPESLDAIRMVQRVREMNDYCHVPIIFLSSPFSEEVQNIYDDLDLMWMVPLPFDSCKFFEALAEVERYTFKNKKILEIRRRIQKALNENKYDTALEYTQKIAKHYSNKFVLNMLIARAYEGLRKFDKALDYVNQALNIRSKSLEASNLKASILRKKGDHKGAENLLEQTMKLAEVHLKNLIHWGDVYMEEGSEDKSITAYERALDMEDENVKAREGLFAANLIAGKVEVAKKVMANGAKSFEIARVCNLRGISMAEKGQYKCAERLYSNAVSFLPDDKKIEHKLWMNLGLCMKKNGEMQAALDYFKKCKEKAPQGYVRVDEQIVFVETEIKKKLLAKTRTSRSTLDGGTLDYSKN
ncbi:MAG: hypothetical protein CMP10_07915 [Zetaproteobacteria bacterium]|nr:hypothetical protein [Pseudobdellovibrionaceae bacterium]